MNARAEHAVDALERPLEIAREPRDELRVLGGAGSGRARLCPSSSGRLRAFGRGSSSARIADERPRHVVPRDRRRGTCPRRSGRPLSSRRCSARSSASTMRLASSSSRLAATGTLQPSANKSTQDRQPSSENVPHFPALARTQRQKCETAATPRMRLRRLFGRAAAACPC